MNTQRVKSSKDRSKLSLNRSFQVDILEQMITLPYNFNPRDQQYPVLKALDSGFKRVIQVWHRRYGKDKVDFNYIIKEAARVPAQYYYFAPTYEQGRKIIWDNIDNDGFKMLDHIPKALIKRVDSTRMLIELTNNSIIQVVGTEDPSKIVGTNPRIAVFTEFSLQNPAVLDFIMPILMANNGIAIFNFTPRGENHAYELYEYAKTMPDEWFVSFLTVDDTHILSPDALEREKARLFAKYKDNALFEQEYYCSFSAPIQGAYYAAWIMEAEKEGRIGNVPYDERVPVDTFWDLGVGDSTAIWFGQTVGREIRMIDYLETSGEGLTYYIRELQKKGYVWGRHVAPHDIEVRELSTGKSRREIARSLGIDFEIAPKLSIEDGIDAGRSIFKRLWFDKEKCKAGVNALKSYQKVYDEKNQTYKDSPLHNWASHGADAFRYFAVAHEEIVDQDPLPDDTVNFTGWY